jgi:hypothetical protein
MAKKMYQTKLTASWTEADEKHPATHMLLSMKEYEKMCEDIRKANAEAYQAKLDAKQMIESIGKENAREREQLRKSYEADHDYQWSLLDIQEKEIKRLEELNKDLLRVARERANAERKMMPKKERSGYKLIKSGATQKKIGYNKNTGAQYGYAWETVLECPYRADIPLNEIGREIFKELKEKVLPGMGAKGYGLKDDDGGLWKGDYGEACKVASEIGMAVVFDYDFSVNMRSRPYRWLITLVTTSSTTVSEDLMG